MSKTILMVVALAMIVMGVIFHLMGRRTRKSLDVPLMSNHTNMLIGGTLMLCGLGMLLYAAIKHP